MHTLETENRNKAKRQIVLENKLELMEIHVNQINDMEFSGERVR